MIGNITRGSDFTQALSYVMNKEKAQLLTSNVPGAFSHDPKEAASEMRAIAQRSRTTIPVYHVSLSPASSDRLKLADWLHLTKEFLHLRNLDSHQYVAVLHHDTTYPDGEKRPHLHLVINLVDDTGRVADVWMDYPKTERVLRHLEQTYELLAVPCSCEVDTRRDTKGQLKRIERERNEYDDPNHNRLPPPSATVRREIQTAIDAAIASSVTIYDLSRHLLTVGVTAHRTEKGIKFEKEGVWFAGYQLGPGYTLPRLEEKLVQQALVRNIAPIVDRVLASDRHLVGKFHTAIRDGEALVLIDNRQSLVVMRAVQTEDGAWRSLGRTHLTDADLVRFMQFEQLRRRLLAQRRKRQSQDSQMLL